MLVFTAFCFYASLVPITRLDSGCGYLANKNHAAMAKMREPNWSMVEVTKPGMYRGAEYDGQMYAPLKRVKGVSRILSSIM